MMKKTILLLSGLLAVGVGGAAGSSADPLKANSGALEAWKDMRFGMFICWGPVSLTGREIGWSRANPTPIAEYDALYKRWHPDRFDAREWARVVKQSGARYVVFLLKHHDGFCLWNTKQTDYNVMNGPFKRDVAGEISAALRAEGIGFFPYYSTCDWYHPDFPVDSPGRAPRDPTKWVVRPVSNLERYTEYLEAQVKELITRYGPLVGVWFDVPQCFDQARGERVIRMMRSLQPDILVNNRVGAPGDFETPENSVGQFDNERPWETNATLTRQWAWKPNDTLRSLEECIRMLVVCACGDGNFVLNTGPMPDGQIEPRQVERFQEIGAWLTKYGESIYGTRGGPFRSPDERKRSQRGYYGNFTLAGGGYWGGSTHRGNSIYVHILRWPGDTLTLPPLPARIVKHAILTGGEATVRQTDAAIEITVPAAQRDAMDTIVRLDLDRPAKDIPVMPPPTTEEEVASPNSQLVLTFRLTEAGAPVYRVQYRGQPILLESRLGLALQEGGGFLEGLKITDVQVGRYHQSWKPVAAEREWISDRYNHATIKLVNAQGRKLHVEVRAYDEGVGFRYLFPQSEDGKAFTIADEVTEFRFTGNHPCWPVYSAQGQYEAGHRLADVKANCERPLTVEIEGGPVVAVGEAGMLDYFRMRLQPSGRPHALKVMPNGVVTGAAPFSTPWRFVLCGDNPGQLLERDFLVRNFNEPCAIKDTSWIKPGKVMRAMTLSTEGGKRYIDFAAQMGMQYILFDAGWYGSWREPDSDASRPYVEHPGYNRKAPPDQRRPKDSPPLDIKAVVQYGLTKGIGVLLYVDRAELEKQGPQLYPLYRDWGVKGVKYGFVQVGTQQWAKWIADQIRLCAENRLMVNIHDEYRPTGFERTWPNLMTCEGVAGDETFATAADNTAKPFTRGLCGPFDNTVCFYTPRLTTEEKSQKSRAFQLAKAVVVFSPLQHLFWYDRPELYQGEPELEFWKTIPVVWDDTRVINGVIGQYITEARRHGREWYVGTLNANERRTLDIPLRFLDPGRKYVAAIYREGAPGSRTAADLTKVTIEKRTVDASTVIKAEVSDIGGHAMRLVPVD